MNEASIQSASPAKAAKRAAREAAAVRKRPDARSSKGQPHLKLQIDFPGGARLGPGKVALLEAIDREGSLSRAAETLGISYRRAWLFMKQINDAFDEVAVATPEHGHGGGPARLTPFGHELIRHFREMEQVAARVGREIVTWLDRHRSAGGGGAQEGA